MRGRSYRWMGIMLAATSTVVAPVARAQSPAADALFEQGRVALAAGDLDTACARFRASDQIDPAAGTRANLGDCEERRGKVASAWAAYRSALERLTPADERTPVIKKRIAALEPRLPRLTLSLAPGAPSDTRVREKDVALGGSATWGVPLPLDPGVHHLTVSAGGVTARIVDVTLVEGKNTRVTIDPGAGPSEPAPAPAEPPPPEPPSGQGSSPGPWIVGGVGLAAIVVGSVTGVVVLQKKSVTNSHCTDGPPPTCRDQAGLDAASAVRTLGPVTTASLVIGAAGVAAGAIWLGVRTGKSTARLGVAPSVAGATWRLEGSW